MCNNINLFKAESNDLFKMFSPMVFIVKILDASEIKSCL